VFSATDYLDAFRTVIFKMPVQSQTGAVDLAYRYAPVEKFPAGDNGEAQRPAFCVQKFADGYEPARNRTGVHWLYRFTG